MATAAGRLTHAWESPIPWLSVFTTVDHKKIAMRYFATALFFFVVAGADSLVMRIQLARPESDLLTPEAYNEAFTVHGTTMIFFFAAPILAGGFGNLLVPLMIGARDMAFPRLNAFAYWVYGFAALFFYTGVVSGDAPNGGWFSYVPLTGSEYTPGMNLDFWALAIIFLGISTTAGAINFIVTIFTMRAPGMTLNRMPLFIWAILSMSFAVLFALPALTLAAALLELDRATGTRFFDPALGGSALLWQHLFWVFGHPEVYIMFLPAVGIVSMVIPTFSRRPVVGYTYLALASVSIAFLSFGVWVHHMFAVGLPTLAISFFAAVGLIIAIPSGIQIFAWIATVWTGRPRLRVPMLWALGFIVVFVIGGITGVMVTAIPVDWQVHDSYFVVAHFHYVLVGGVVFPIMAGLTYWFPKATGRLLNERLGQLGFWFTFVGFNVTFFPMHIVGLLGMPRRVYTYQDGLGWGPWNMLITAGAMILAFGVLINLVSLVAGYFRGYPADDNPWGAGTLEWATSSPPPPYNFREIPAVHGREPLWQAREEGQDELEASPAGQSLAEPRHDQREALATSTLDALPASYLRMPSDSPWPLTAALGLFTLAFGFLFNSLEVAGAGTALTALSFGAWLWPSAEVGV